jgi:hypothetical protein
VARVAAAPYGQSMPEVDHETSQRELAVLNVWRLDARLPLGDDALDLHRELVARRIEIDSIERARARIAPLAATAPIDPAGFVAWFESLRDHGPGQHDPLFPWLATRATRDEMRWFLTQELAGEAGFDDLVALTQLRMPTRAKHEMGRGRAEGMHGPMLTHLAEALDVPTGAPIVIEALELSNLMMALAHQRRYAYQSVGALGVIELTAPGRSALVNAGLERIGVPAPTRRYFALHAAIDIKHSASWNREVLAPLVAADPATAHAMAEGALMRLAAGARCFDRYRAHFDISVA